MKDVAKKVLEMKDGDYGSKELSSTVGGCSVNTSRGANMYLQALPSGGFINKVITAGSIGGDESGKYIETKLKEEQVLAFLHK